MQCRSAMTVESMKLWLNCRLANGVPALWIADVLARAEALGIVALHRIGSQGDDRMLASLLPQ